MGAVDLDDVEAGIILTGSAKEKPTVAEVISVGPGGVVDGKDVVMTVKVGDKVITDKYAGSKITLRTWLDGSAHILHKGRRLPFKELDAQVQMRRKVG